MARSEEEYKKAEYIRRRLPKNRYIKARFDAGRRPSGAKAFTITLEEYTQIISQPCRYCGCDISQDTGSGIDRINNDLGYEPGNCSPCCPKCNTRRSKSMDADIFEQQSRDNGYRVD